MNKRTLHSNPTLEEYRGASNPKPEEPRAASNPGPEEYRGASEEKIILIHEREDRDNHVEKKRKPYAIIMISIIAAAALLFVIINMGNGSENKASSAEAGSAQQISEKQSTSAAKTESTGQTKSGDVTESEGVSQEKAQKTLEEDTKTSESYVDCIYDKEDIEACRDGLGDWEADYNMAVSGDKTFTWGYIDMAIENNFTTMIRNSCNYYCKLNFPNVTILQGDGKWDSEIQLQLCKNFITLGVDCIILDAVDADGCLPIVELCQKEKMPLVLVNAVVHTDLINNGVGYVGCDNYQAGALQAEWILDHIDDTQTVNICYQKGTEGYDHTALREMGVFETLDAAGFNYKLLDTQISDFLRDTARKNAEAWIEKYGDQVTVIPCVNDESAMGTMEAYQNAGLLRNVAICGIDANTDALEEVKNGYLACTVFQNGLAQAKWAAISAYDACVKGTVETQGVDCPFELITSFNVDDYL